MTTRHRAVCSTQTVSITFLLVVSHFFCGDAIESILNSDPMDVAPNGRIDSCLLCRRPLVLRPSKGIGSSSGGDGGGDGSGGGGSSSSRMAYISGDISRGSLSRGRGFMGAAMLDDPSVMVFAGGIGRGGTVVEASADVLSGVRNDGQDATVVRDVLSLRIPRTDVASGTSSRAMYFAGGCGIDSPAPDTDTQNGRRRKPARRDASGDDASSAPDLPLLVRRCQPTDVIDIFAPIAGTGGAGELKVAGKVPVSATSNFRLCEPKYASTVGVFYTGTPDNGDPSDWSPTTHVMIAGGIIPTSEEQYTATNTIDILREEGIDPSTGKVHMTKLAVQRLPNPPRFEMTPCCFKHQCVFAGGRVSMGPGGVGFNSDMLEVWDGATWSFATWGEHTLSEPKHLMGSAVIEITIGEKKRTVGIFAGGVSNVGNSTLVDMFDFDERRLLPSIHAPTVSGPTQGISISREAAAFVSESGHIDVFNGRTLCWTSYQCDGFSPGMSVIGHAPAWFFNASSSGFQQPGGVGGGWGRDAVAYIGGGVGGSSGTDVSREVRELSWGPRVMDDGEDAEVCLGGESLRALQKVCGLPGLDGSIQGFTPHSCEDVAATGVARVALGPSTVLVNWAFKTLHLLDAGVIPANQVPPEVPHVGVAGAGAPGSEAGDARGRPSDKRLVLYIVAGLLALVVSYMVSAMLILRKVEGLWRLPFGGGVVEALCGASSCCCCRSPSDRRRAQTDAGGAGGENGSLLPAGDIETVSNREGSRDSNSLLLLAGHDSPTHGAEGIHSLNTGVEVTMATRVEGGSQGGASMPTPRRALHPAGETGVSATPGTAENFARPAITRIVSAASTFAPSSTASLLSSFFIAPRAAVSDVRRDVSSEAGGRSRISSGGSSSSEGAGSTQPLTSSGPNLSYATMEPVFTTLGASASASASASAGSGNPAATLVAEAELVPEDSGNNERLEENRRGVIIGAGRGGGLHVRLGGQGIVGECDGHPNNFFPPAPGGRSVG